MNTEISVDQQHNLSNDAVVAAAADNKSSSICNLLV